MAGRRGKGDLDTLPERAGRGARAVGEVAGAFEELSRTGTVSNQSLSAVARSLGSLGPAGAIAGVGLATIVGKFEAVAKAGEKVISGAFRDFNRGLELQAGFEAKAAASGGELAEKYSRLGQIAVGLADAEQLRSEALKAVDEETKKNLSLFSLLQNGMGGVRDATLNLTFETKQALVASANRTVELEKERAALEDEISTIDANRDAWKNYERARTLAREVSRLTFAKASSFTEQLTEDERQEIEMARVGMQIAQQKAAVELETSGKITKATKKRIGELQREIDELERQRQLMQRVGAIAESAIGQTATGAFDAYAAALDKTVSLNALFEKSTDRTLRNVAAATIRNVGRQAAVEGAMEAARALASLAIRDFEAAGNHAAASAAFFGVAAAAGAAAGLVSVKGAGSGGGGRRAGGGSSKDGGPNYFITIIGDPDYEGKQRVAGWVAEIAAGAG